MRKFICGSFVVAALLAASSASAAVNLITNGSFENGLTGWTSTNVRTSANPIVTTYNNTSNYPANPVGERITTDTIRTSPNTDSAGSHFLYLSSDTGTNTLSQSITLLAGHTYTFGFDYYLPANGYANPGSFTLAVQLAGQTLGVLSSSNGAGAAQWYTANTTPTTVSADATSMFTLVYSGSGTTSRDLVLDRVYAIDATPTPEPATWMMMIVGFGAIGTVLRRRDRLVPA